MPIYEYEAVEPDKSCPRCHDGFETLQNINDNILSVCPDCGNRIRKKISWCRAAVVETSPEQSRITDKITNYEKAGLWSHAAELADKHAEKTKDKSLRTRALDNYQKAGYDADSLAKHDTLKD